MNNHDMLAYYGEQLRIEVCGREMHCGETFQVNIGGDWHEATIERSGERWIVRLHHPGTLPGLEFTSVRDAWALDHFQCRLNSVVA